MVCPSGPNRGRPTKRSRGDVAASMSASRCLSASAIASPNLCLASTSLSHISRSSLDSNASSKGAPLPIHFRWRCFFVRAYSGSHRVPVSWQKTYYSRGPLAEHLDKYRGEHKAKASALHEDQKGQPRTRIILRDAARSAQYQLSNQGSQVMLMSKPGGLR